MLDWERTKIAFPLVTILAIGGIIVGGATKISALENQMQRDRMENEFRLEIVRLKANITTLNENVDKLRAEQQDFNSRVMDFIREQERNE